MSLIGGLLMLPSRRSPASAEASAAAPAAASGRTGRGPPSPARTVASVRRQAVALTASSVTVSQTRNLVNQKVQVTWTGFTPSATLLTTRATDYPVMIAECEGAHPTSPRTATAPPTAASPAARGPFGPTTPPTPHHAEGTGVADIQIDPWQNQFLGCGLTHACSLVIVPARAATSSTAPPNCADHTQDGVFAHRPVRVRRDLQRPARGRSGSWSR